MTLLLQHKPILHSRLATGLSLDILFLWGWEWGQGKGHP